MSLRHRRQVVRRRRTRSYGWTLMGLILGATILILGASLFYRREGAVALHPPAKDEAVAVYVVDNGFHTDLILPRREIEAHGGALAMAVAQMPPSDWIHVGWGDADFFMDQSPIRGRWKDGLRALAGQDRGTVLRLYPGYGQDPRFEAEALQKLHLSPRGLEQVIRRVDQSLKLDRAGQPQLRLYLSSDPTWFFESGERFWIGHLCNHWTLEVLNAGGIRVWPWRLMTAGEVKRQARLAERLAAETLDLGPQAH